MVLLVGMGAFWGYRQLFPPDEVRIRRTLHRAAEAASIPPKESMLAKLTAVNAVLDECTPEIEVVLDGPGMRIHTVQGEDQLREMLAAVRGSTESIAIQLMEITVEVNPDRTGATAQFIARARVSGGEDEMVQEFQVVLQRIGRGWKIHRVEPLRSLQLPPGQR